MHLVTIKYLETGEWLVQNTMEKCFHVPSIQASQLHSTLLKGIYGCGDDKWWGGFAQSFRIFFGDGQIKEGCCEKNTKQNFGMHDN
jgi:hypothetical protein